VRHVGEELALVAVRRLDLAHQPADLGAHPVRVVGERAELVAVRHVHTLREVAGGDLAEACVHLLDRPDQRL